MIKTRKIKLIPTGISKDIKNKKITYIKDIASTLSKVGNEVIRLHVGNQYEIDSLTKGKIVTKGEAVKILETKLGTSIRNSGYQQMSTYPQIPSSIRSGFNSVIFKTISNNFYDIINGKMSIPSFRKNKIAFPISARNDKETGVTNAIKIKDDKYVLSIPTSRGVEFEDTDFELFFGKDKSNNRVIVDRVLDGTYKLCDSSVLLNENDIYFLLTVDIPVAENKNLNQEKVMGIDVGINRPVSIYITDEKHQPEQISIGEKIQHDRIKMSKKRQSLQKSLKYTSGGHGTKNKLKGLDKLKEVEKNWATLINHKISKEVVDVCLKYNVGTINMEDLTGITAKTNDYFLKTWKFYELQNFIKYKAEFANMKVIWVNPAYTSLTCPVCGISSAENRKDKDKTKFKCTNELCKCYNIEKDADVIASENIAKLKGNDLKAKSKKGRLEKAKAILN